MFLQEEKHALANCFGDTAWLAKLACVAKILRHLNELNTDMHGWHQAIRDISGKNTISLKKKIEFWREKNG